MGRRSVSQGPPAALPVIQPSASILAAGITRLLSVGDVHAGRRLRPVRDLAILFGVDKGKVCAALDELVEKGVLIKRHGSGTFIRSVPRIRDTDETASPVRGLVAADILAPLGDGTSRRKPLSGHRKLTFQLWTTPDEAMPVLAGIASGIGDVLGPGGHLLQEKSTLPHPRLMQEPGDLAARLSSEPADGYLVFGQLEQFFEQQFQATGKPWISFGFSGPLRHHPGMIMDCLEAVQRGTQALLEGGCRRVAMLGYPGRRKDMDFEVFQYSSALREAGVENYHKALFVKAERAEVRHALEELLDSSAPPDGLYIADDTLLPLVASDLDRRGIVPGRDLGVVTYWNEGNPGFKGFDRVNWSRMEISPRRFGQTLARSLLAATQSAVTGLASYRILAEWRPGSTHFAPGGTGKR